MAKTDAIEPPILVPPKFYSNHEEQLNGFHRSHLDILRTRQGLSFAE